jgi:hypothetical protein
LFGERSADRSPKGLRARFEQVSGLQASGAPGLRLLPFPMRSQPCGLPLRLAGYHDGAADQRPA